MTAKDREQAAAAAGGMPLARFRARMRRRVALPLSLASAACAAVLGLWAEGSPPDATLIWTILLLICIAAIAPLWADEAKPGRVAQSAVPWLVVAAIFATLLSWRTPDPTGGAAVAMAAVAPAAGMLLAWLYRRQERAQRKGKRSGGG